MTIDHRVAARLKDRSLAWRLGAATTAALGDRADWRGRCRWISPKPRTTASSATPPPTTCSGTARWPTTSISSTGAKISCASGRSIRAGPKASSSSAGETDWPHHLLTPSRSSIRCFAAPFIWLFGTNGFLVLHALLMTLCFACAYAFLVARSHPVAALIFAFAFVFVSVAPIYMVRIAPDFFNFAIVLFAYLLLVLQGSRRPGRPTAARGRGAHAGCWRRGPTSSPPCCSASRRSPSRRSILLIAPLLASALLRRQWLRGLKIGGVFAPVAAACSR